MKTLIVNIPDKYENIFITLFKQFRIKPSILTEEDLEHRALGKWIDKGMKSEDIPEEAIFEIFRKHGIIPFASS